MKTLQELYDYNKTHQNHKSFAEEWEFYAKTMFTEEMPDARKQHFKQAFYTGGLACFAFLQSLGGTGRENVQEKMKQRHEEVLQWCHDESQRLQAKEN